MLLGNILMTPSGIRIYDVDGSSIELSAGDALDLSVWLLQVREQLLDLSRNDIDRERNKEQAS